jgi:hypothetical protein
MSAHRDLDQRLEIGRAVETGRRNGVAWKALMRVYGSTERQLRRDRDAWRAQMSDNSAQMSGFSDCLGHEPVGQHAPAFATQGTIDVDTRSHCHLSPA